MTATKINPETTYMYHLNLISTCPKCMVEETSSTSVPKEREKLWLTMNNEIHPTNKG